MYNTCSFTGFCIALFEQIFGSTDELRYAKGVVFLQR